MTAPSTFYNWIRELPAELKQLDEIPLTGNASAFPWDQLSTRLATTFERKDLLIEPKDLLWRSKNQLYEGLSDDPFALNFTVPSLRGQVSWVMPEQEMNTLETLLLTKETHPISFQDRSLSESFYKFIAIEVLYQFTQIAYDKSLIPLLSKQTDLFQQDALCLDISITIQKQIIWGRLIISPDFRRSWVEHFAHQNPSSLSQQLAKAVEVDVKVEGGKTDLTLKQWLEVQLGDLIILDHCALDAITYEGRVFLTVQNQLIFRGKVKDGNLKILELPLLNEALVPMAKYPLEENDEDDLTDLSLNLEEETLEEEDQLASLDEEPLEAEQNLETSKTPEQLKASSDTSINSTKAVSPEKIPVTLTVEVGRIQMTMDHLLKLEPGNLLELDLHPEKGVMLTINGSLVGKGELLRIGELVGVRVLELGK